MSFFCVSLQEDRIALACLVSMTCRFVEDSSKGLVVLAGERVDGQVRNVFWLLFVGYVYAGDALMMVFPLTFKTCRHPPWILALGNAL